MTGLPLPEESGWKFKEESESYSFDWYCAELQESERDGRISHQRLYMQEVKMQIEPVQERSVSVD